MKNHLTLAVLLVLQFSAVAQNKLVKDIDFDGKADTVYIDQKEWKIVCQLSSQNFKKLTSKPIETAGDHTFLEPKKNGFELRVNWMRSGYAVQFSYEKKEKRVRAIGISQYAFGNAANDGSGEASFNLLTGDYIGNWHYYDHLANNEKGELVKIPAIKTKMQFRKIYLEDFNEEAYYAVTDKVSLLVEKHKELERKRRAKN